MVECEHIHNKVLFDCINDSLLQFKAYGKAGKPLPWSRHTRKLNSSDDFSIHEIFEIVKHDVSLNFLLTADLVVPLGHNARRHLATP